MKCMIDMFTRRIFGLMLLTANALCLEAQHWKMDSTDEFCKPSVIGLPRAKGIIIKYEMLPAFNIRSDGRNGYADASNRVIRNGRLEAKIRFPIVNKPSLAVAMGLGYFQEEFHFKDKGATNYPVYRALQDKDLRSAGVQLYVVKPTRSNKYFLLRTSAELNGDFTNQSIPKSQFLKISIAPLLGWKKNDNLSYAVGLAYGYLFGRPSIYPLFSYNRNFNRYWGIETLLPASIKLRYSRCDKTFWYGIAEIKGASYRLSNSIPGLTAIANPHIHRSELRILVSMERELHNWLWLGAEAGWRQNLQFNLTNSPGRNSDVLIKSRLGAAPVASISLFAVPPRRLLRE